jgi:hypothetical protein
MIPEQKNTLGVSPSDQVPRTKLTQFQDEAHTAVTRRGKVWLVLKKNVKYNCRQQLKTYPMSRFCL